MRVIGVVLRGFDYEAKKNPRSGSGAGVLFVCFSVHSDRGRRSGYGGNKDDKKDERRQRDGGGPFARIDRKGLRVAHGGGSPERVVARRTRRERNSALPHLRAIPIC